MSAELSDADSISTTSTAASEPQERYNLEGILAQSGEGEDATYLAKWEGYPIERCTWEAAENFDPETLNDWYEKKTLIEAGKAEEFDVEAFLEKVNKFEQDTADRKERREKKRKRLARKRRALKLDHLRKLRGFSQSDESSDYSSDTSSRTDTHDEVLDIVLDDSVSDDQPPRKKRRPSTTHVQKPQTTPKLSKAKLPAVNKSIHTKSISKATSTASSTRPTSSRYEGTVNNATTRVVTQKKPQLPQMSKYVDLKPARKENANKLAAIGAGPKARPKPINVLGDNWNSAPKSRKSVRGGDIDPNKKAEEGVKPYRLLSKVWMREKGARNEKPPDPSVLGLFDPKTFSVKEHLNIAAYRPYHSGIESRTPFEQLKAAQQGASMDNVAMDDGPLQEAITTPLHDGHADTLFVDEPAEMEAREDTVMHKAPEKTRHPQRSASEPQLQQPISSETAAAPPAPMLVKERVVSHGFEPVNGPVTVTQPPKQPTEPKQAPSRQNTPRDPQTPIMQGEPAGATAKSNPTATKSLLKRSISASTSVSSRPVMESQRPKITLIPPNLLQRRVFTKHFNEIIGDQGMTHDSWKGKEDGSDMYGELALGPNKELVSTVIFRGLHLGVNYLLLTIRKDTEVIVWCRDTITAEEWGAQYDDGGAGYYGAGHIVAKSYEHRSGRNEQPVLQGIADQLHHTGRGGLFQAQWYTMLVYPAGDKRWERADSLYRKRAATPLRFLIRSRIDPVPIVPRLDIHSLNIADDSLPNPSLETHMSETQQQSITNVKTIEQMPESSHPQQGPETKDQPVKMDLIDSLNSLAARNAFEYCFTCKMEDLLVLGGGKVMGTDPIKIFLHWPADQSAERDVVAKWLEKIEGWKSKVYTSTEEWVLFSQKIVSTGIVMVHRSVPANEIQFLRRILSTADFNVFFLNLQVAVDGKPVTLMKVSPVGCAFLILDSMVIDRPGQISLILSWYRHIILRDKPRGTWTFVTRPRFREFLTSIIKDKEQESRGSSKHWKDMFRIYERMAPLETMDSGDEFQTPLPTAPYYSPYGIKDYDLEAGTGDKRNDKELIAKNDNLLVTGFGKWSLTKLQQHRKYSIPYDPNNQTLVGTTEGKEKRLVEQWTEQWQHIKVQTYRDFLDFNNVDRDESRYFEKLKQRAGTSATGKTNVAEP